MNATFEKILRRRDVFLEKYFPRNLKYKPNGYFSSLKAFLERFSDEGNYQEVFQPYQYTLDISPDFAKACSYYVKPVLDIKSPSTYIVRIPSGRFYSDVFGKNQAVIYDNKIVGDLSFQWNNDQFFSVDQNRILSNKGFVSPKHLPGGVLSLLSGGGASKYYYHFLIDSIAKIHLLNKSKFKDEVDFYIFPSYKRRYEKEIAEILKIDPERIIDGSKYRHISADLLFVTSQARGDVDHIPHWMPDFFRSTFIQKLGLRKTHHSRVYISRKDATVNRRIRNEDDLISVLEKYDFEVIVPSNHAIREQIEIFYFADFIISAHGGGLTNLVFCRSGTTILEFFPSTYVRHSYYDVSIKFDLDYHYLVFHEDTEAHNAVEGQKIDITVDIKKFENTLAKILKGRPSDL